MAESKQDQNLIAEEHNTSTELLENITKSFVNYQKAFVHLMTHMDESKLEADPMHVTPAAMKASEMLMENPQLLIDRNAELAKNYMKLYNNFCQKLLGNEAADLFSSATKDSRFQDPTWDTHPMFNFLKQSYYLNSNWLKDTLGSLKELDQNSKRKLEFVMRGFIDAAAPTNSPLTNPTVIRQTLETAGANLAKGAENFLHDVEKSTNGALKISTTDLSSFSVGGNLAVTKGKIVYQNELMQLIQYEPTTKQVYQTPLIIMPAWINKYYILDLQDKNSFVKWLVDQGHTVYMISWINPDNSLSNMGFEEYMKYGPLAALGAVQDLAKVPEVNFMGYCYEAPF